MESLKSVVITVAMPNCCDHNFKTVCVCVCVCVCMHACACDQVSYSSNFKIVCVYVCMCARVCVTKLVTTCVCNVWTVTHICC